VPKRTERPPPTEDGFRIEDGGQLKDVTIKGNPLQGLSSSREHYFLVLFRKTAGPGAARERRQPANPGRRSGSRLQRELAAAKEYLQSSSRIMQIPRRAQGGERRGAGGGNEELETAQEELNQQRRNEHAEQELKISNTEFSKVNRDLRI